MIRANTLSVTLGGRPVLRDVSLAFTPGRVSVLLGPNGAGKSSLMRALAGLLPSDAVFLDDRPMATLGRHERARRIGYLPQEGVPAWNISARELVALGRLPYHSPFAAESEADRAMIDAALAATDGTALADRTVGTLSGGELARIKLARLIAGNPDWLLADEPLANLDPSHQRDMLSLLRATAAKGKGVIVVLHQIDAAISVADDLVLLKGGSVVAAGPTTDVLSVENMSNLFGAEFDIQQSQGKPRIHQIW